MEKSKSTWYYASVHNYSKRSGVERTIILNPEHTKEEIAEIMEKSGVGEYISEGIFLDRDISIVAKDRGMELSCQSYEDGHQGVYFRKTLAKKDKLTFHAGGTFFTEYHYTLLEKIEIFFEGVCEMVTEIAKKWRKKQNIC